MEKRGLYSEHRHVSISLIVVTETENVIFVVCKYHQVFQQTDNDALHQYWPCRRKKAVKQAESRICTCAAAMLIVCVGLRTLCGGGVCVFVCL